MQLASNYLVIAIVILLKLSVSSGSTKRLNCKHHSYGAAPTPTFDASARSENSNKFNQVIGGGRFIQIKRNRQCQKNFIGLKRHPYDTKLYYICRQNSIILAKCDESQFSEKYKDCVATKNQTKTSTDTTACSMSGIYPNPGDTRSYYTCVFYKRHFIKRNYKCSDHNVFDATKKKCAEITKPSSCSTTENCRSEGEYMSNRKCNIKPPHEIFEIIKKKKKRQVQRLFYNYKPIEFIDFSSTEDSRDNENFRYLNWFTSKNKVGTKRSKQCNCSNCRSTTTRRNKYNITGSYTDDEKHENVAENQNEMNGEGINDDELRKPENRNGNDENFDIYKDSQNDHTICNDSAITKNDQTNNDGNKDIDEDDLKTEIENGSNIGTTEGNKCEKETEQNGQIGENGEPNAEPESLGGDSDNNMEIRSDNDEKFSNSGSNKRDKNVDECETDSAGNDKNGNIDNQNEKSGNDDATENENGGKASSSGNTSRTNNVNELEDTKRNNFTNPDIVNVHNINVPNNDEITHCALQPRTNNKNSLNTTKSNEQTDSKGIGDAATNLSKPENNATDKGQEAEKDTTMNIEKATGTSIKGVNGSEPNNEDNNANHNYQSNDATFNKTESGIGGKGPTNNGKEVQNNKNEVANNRNADGSEVINKYAEGNNHKRDETYPANGTLTENQSDTTKDRNDTGSTDKRKELDKENVTNSDVQSQNSGPATKNLSEIDLQENQSSADIDNSEQDTGSDKRRQDKSSADIDNHNKTEMREHDNENTREAEETGNITKFDETINGTDLEIQIIKQSDHNDPKPINNTTKETARNNATYEGKTGTEAKGGTVNHGNDNVPSDNENKTEAEVNKGIFEETVGNKDSDSEIKNENKNDLGNDKPRETDPKENQTFVVKNSDDNDPRSDKNPTANGGTETSNDEYSGASSGNELILLNKETESGSDADKRQDGGEKDNMEDANNVGGSDNQINGTGTQNETETINNEDPTAGANFDPSNEPLDNNDQTDQNTSRHKEVDVPQKISEIDNGANKNQNNKDSLTEIEKRTDPTTWSLLENGVTMPNNNNPDVGESDQMTDTKTVNENITDPFIVADTVENKDKRLDNNDEMDKQPEIVNRTDTGTGSKGADDYSKGNKTVPNIENTTVLENKDASNVGNESDGVRENQDTKGFEQDKEVDTIGMDEVAKGIYTNKDETGTAPVLNTQNNKDPETNDTTVDHETDGAQRNEDNKGFEEVKDISREVEGTDGINGDFALTDKVSEFEDLSDVETNTTGMDEDTKGTIANKEKTDTTIQPTSNIENNTFSETSGTSKADNESNGVRGNEDNKGFEEDKEADRGTEPEAAIHEDLGMTDKEPEIETPTDIGKGSKGTNEDAEGKNSNKGETDTASQTIPNYENKTISEANDTPNVDNASDGARGNEGNKGIEEDKEAERGTEPEAATNGDLGMTDKEPEIETRPDVENGSTGPNKDTEGNNANQGETDTASQTIPNYENKTVSEANGTTNVDNEPDGVLTSEDNKGFEEDKEADRGTEPEAATNGDLGMTDKEPEIETRTDIGNGSTAVSEDTDGKNDNKGETDIASQAIPNYENKTVSEANDTPNVDNEPDGVLTSEDNKGFEEDKEADRGTEPEAATNGDLGMTDKEPEIETRPDIENGSTGPNEDTEGKNYNKGETDTASQTIPNYENKTVSEANGTTNVDNEPDGVLTSEENKGFEEDKEADRGTEPEAGSNGDLGMTDKEPEVETRTDIENGSTGANEDTEGKNANKGETDTASQTIPNYDNKTVSEANGTTNVDNEPDGVLTSEDNKGFEEDKEADRGTEPEAAIHEDLGMTDKEPEIETPTDIGKGSTGTNEDADGKNDNKGETDTASQAIPNYENKTVSEANDTPNVDNAPDGVLTSEDNKGFAEDKEADRGTEPEAATNGDLGITDKEPEIETRPDIGNGSTAVSEDTDGKNDNKGETDIASQTIPNYENKTVSEANDTTNVDNEPDGVLTSEDNKGFEEDKEADRGTEPEAGTYADLGMTDKEPEIETRPDIGNGSTAVSEDTDGKNDNKGETDIASQTIPNYENKTVSEANDTTNVDNEPDGVLTSEDNKGFEEDKEADRGTEPEAGTYADLGMTDKEPEIETRPDIGNGSTAVSEDTDGKNDNKGETDIASQTIPNYENKTVSEANDTTNVDNEPDGVLTSEDNKGFEEDKEADRGTEPEAATNGDLGITDKEPEIETRPDIGNGSTAVSEDTDGKNDNKGETDIASQAIPNYENKTVSEANDTPNIDNAPDGVLTSEDNKGFEEDKEADRGTEPEAGTNGDLGMTDKEPEIETPTDIGKGSTGTNEDADGKNYNKGETDIASQTIPNYENKTVSEANDTTNVDNEPDGVLTSEDNKGFEEDKEADRGTEPEAATNGDLGITDKEPEIETRPDIGNGSTAVSEDTDGKNDNKGETDIASQAIPNYENKTVSEANDTPNIDNAPDGVLTSEDNKGFEEDKEADRGTEPEAGTNGDLGMTDKEPEIETPTDIGKGSTGTNEDADGKNYNKGETDIASQTIPNYENKTVSEANDTTNVDNEPDGVLTSEDNKGFEEDKEADRGTEPEAATNGDLGITDKEPEIETRPDIGNGSTAVSEDTDGKNDNKGETDIASQTIPNYENKTVSEANDTTNVDNEPDGVLTSEDNKGFEEDKEADRGTEPEAGTYADLGMTDKEPEIETRPDIGNGSTAVSEDTDGKNVNKGETDIASQTIPNYENKTVSEANDTTNVDNAPDGVLTSEDNKGIEEDKEADRGTEPEAGTNGDLGITDKEPEIETRPDIGNGSTAVSEDTDGKNDNKGETDIASQTIPNYENKTVSEANDTTNIDNEPDGVLTSEDNKGFEEDKEADRGTEPEAATNGDLGITDKEPEIETRPDIGNGSTAVSEDTDGKNDNKGETDIASQAIPNYENKTVSEANDTPNVDNAPDGVLTSEDNKGFEEDKEADRGTEPEAGTNGDLGMTDKEPEIETPTDIGKGSTGTNEDADGKNYNKGETDTASQTNPNYENKAASEANDTANFDNEPDGVLTSEDNKGIEEDKEADRGTEPEVAINEDLGMTDKEPEIETRPDIENGSTGANEDAEGKISNKGETDSASQAIPNYENKTVSDASDTPNVDNEPYGVRGNEGYKGFEEDKEADRGTEPEAPVWDYNGASNIGNEYNKYQENAYDNKEAESYGRTGLADTYGKQLPQRNRLASNVGNEYNKYQENVYDQGTEMNKEAESYGRTGQTDTSGKQLPQKNAGGLVQVRASLPVPFVPPKRVNLRLRI